MSDTTNFDFANLHPDLVLDAVEMLDFRVDGRIIALNSYENRVYQIYLEDGSMLVTKFYRPGRWSDDAILEEHQFASELATAEIPVLAPLLLKKHSLHFHQNYRFAIYRRQSGRPPECNDTATLSWMGRYLGRIHQIGGQQKFLHRPTLDLANYGQVAYDYLLQNKLVPEQVAGAYFQVCQQALHEVAECYANVGDVALIRSHGDCHWGNVLWCDTEGQLGPWFVDFDDARMAPPLQDLWMLLSGSRTEMRTQLATIVDAYSDFLDFDTRQLRLLEALRTQRLLHYSAWLAQRWTDPAFPRAFPWFGSLSYWQARTAELTEQIELMRMPALVI